MSRLQEENLRLREAFKAAVRREGDKAERLKTDLEKSEVRESMFLSPLSIVLLPSTLPILYSTAL